MQRSFKQIIVVFFAIWWLIALWTDIIGGLAHLGYIKATWAPDNNYPFLVKSLTMYHLPEWVSVFLYLGIILCSAISSWLFLYAACTMKKPQWLNRVNLAFIFSMGYWLLFFLADQLIMNFDLEENHMVQGGFELLCYLVINLIPIETTDAI